MTIGVSHEAGVTATWRGRLSTAFASEAVRGAGLSLGLKIGSSALNLVMLMLVARSMNAHEFGVFAFWFNLLLFLGVSAGLGQEKLILRQWTEYRAAGGWDLARGVLAFGTLASIAGAVAFAAAVAIVGLANGTDPFLVSTAAAFLIVWTLFVYTAHVNRTMLGILRGDVHDMTWRAIVSVALAIALLSRTELRAAHFFLVATLAMGVALAAQGVSVLRHLPAAIRSARARTETRLWWKRSFKMAVGGNLEAAAQYLEVIAVGLVLAPAAAGSYFVAARLSSIFLMVSSGLDSYTTRQIPHQYYTHGRAGVADTLRKVALMTSAPVLLGLVATILFGRPILAIFGEAFVSAYPVLVILSVGTAVLALAGPAMPLLVLTGHEGTYSLLLGAGLALRLVSLLALAFWFGEIGAALGSAVSVALGAVALNLACRRKAGLDPAVTNLLAPRDRRPA